MPAPPNPPGQRSGHRATRVQQLGPEASVLKTISAALLAGFGGLPLDLLSVRDRAAPPRK